MTTELIDKSFVDQLITDLGDAALDLMPELIEALENDMAKSIASLNDGLEQNDRQEIYDAAHRLKGSCANMGAVSVAHQCGLLEDRAFDEPLDVLSADVQDIDRLCEETLVAFRNYPVA